MELYKLERNASALKELKELPKENASRIFNAIEELANNPFPNKVKKLADSENGFRVCISDYRVIYNNFPKTLTVEIIRIKHRKNVFK